jgi:ring-1,2-phenylacetyl-CoA epoxidase subunit PaaC
LATLNQDTQTALIELLLSIADDKLMLGHRNADWTGLGPILEEDIAFSSIAQDELSHAFALYEFIGKLSGSTADHIAYGRAPEEYRCAAIVEPPDEFDYATALVRQFFCDHFDGLRLMRLSRSSDAGLAALGKRMAAEERIHVEHADAWVRRLGAGGEEARARVQAALEGLAPHADSLFEPTKALEQLEKTGIYPLLDPPLFEQWRTALESVAAAAKFTLPLAAVPNVSIPGGRRGRHSGEFRALLDEMCEVYRVEPEAAW